MKLGQFALTTCLVAFFFCPAGAVQGQEGTGQQIGKQVDQAVERLREGAKDVASKVREEFEAARASVDRLSVAGRVYARLHWDKALHNASISVEVRKDGSTTLRGTVPSEKAKVKAGQITDDTVGVERVVNELKVQTPATR